MEIKPTLNRSWRDLLTATLTRARKNDAYARVAVMGIGNELRGDDAAGVLVARALVRAPSLEGRDVPHISPLQIIDAGTAPENFSGVLRRLKPDVIVLIDAAEMNETPGTICACAYDDARGFDASTHTLSFAVLGNYLASELACDIFLLGIQPAVVEFGARVSAPVTDAVRQVTRALESVLSDS